MPVKGVTSRTLALDLALRATFFFFKYELLLSLSLLELSELELLSSLGIEGLPSRRLVDSKSLFLFSLD